MFICLYCCKLLETSAILLHVSKDIEQLLQSVLKKSGRWYETAPDDVKEFLNAIEQLVATNKQVNAVSIRHVLKDSYAYDITETSVRTWLNEVKKNYQTS